MAAGAGLLGTPVGAEACAGAEVGLAAGWHAASAIDKTINRLTIALDYFYHFTPA
jgi:hypothetical protein